MAIFQVLLNDAFPKARWDFPQCIPAKRVGDKRAGFGRNLRPATCFLRDGLPPLRALLEAARDAIGQIHPSLMGGL